MTIYSKQGRIGSFYAAIFSENERVVILPRCNMEQRCRLVTRGLRSGELGKVSTNTFGLSLQGRHSAPRLAWKLTHKPTPLKRKPKGTPMYLICTTPRLKLSQATRGPLPADLTRCHCQQAHCMHPAVTLSQSRPLPYPEPSNFVLRRSCSCAQKTTALSQDTIIQLRSSQQSHPTHQFEHAPYPSEQEPEQLPSATYKDYQPKPDSSFEEGSRPPGRALCTVLSRLQSLFHIAHHA